MFNYVCLSNAKSFRFIPLDVCFNWSDILLYSWHFHWLMPRDVYCLHTNPNRLIVSRLPTEAKTLGFWFKLLFAIFWVWLFVGSTHPFLSYLGWRGTSRAPWDLPSEEFVHATTSRPVVFRTFWIQFQNLWGWAGFVDWHGPMWIDVAFRKYFPIGVRYAHVDVCGL
jgi:hypothetical protein